MAFFYAFIYFAQPGILWLPLGNLRPMLILSTLATLVALTPRYRGSTVVSSYLHNKALIWLGAYVFIQILSVHYSGLASMLYEFGLWYMFPMFVLISLLLLRDESALRSYIWGVLLGGMVVIGYGLNTYLTRPAALQGRTVGAYGMYENHNDYTFMALSLLPLAWMLIRDQRRLVAKLVLALIVVSCIAAVLVSLSRGGVLVLALEVALLLFMTTRGFRRAFLLSGFLAMAPAVIVYQFVARDAGRTSDYTVEVAQSSRYELWKAAGNMIFAHPILGVGSHRISEFTRDYAEISHDNVGKNSHNTYLEILAGSGLLGFSAFVAMIWTSMVPLKRSLPKKGQELGSLDNIKTAVFIAFICLLVRSFIDVKIFEPCLFTLFALAVSVTALGKTRSAEAPIEASVSQPQPRLRDSSYIYRSSRST